MHKSLFAFTKSPPRLAANGTKEKTIKGMKPIAIEVHSAESPMTWRKPSPGQQFSLDNEA